MNIRVSRVVSVIILLIVYTFAVSFLKWYGLISWDWLVIAAPFLLFASAFAAFASLVVLTVLILKK